MTGMEVTAEELKSLLAGNCRHRVARRAPSYPLSRAR